MFYQNFTIHPVGQGLFYSGEIKLNKNSVFKMIYDCGSVTKGAKNEALSYRTEKFSGTVKELDLLIISHFDADHVNQIKTVVGNDVKIKKLVMPFITFEERLYLALKHFAKPDKNEDVIDIIIDPIATLGQNLGKDGEVYIITSEDGPIPDDQDEISNNDKNPEQRLVFRFGNTNNLSPEDSLKLNLRGLSNKVNKTTDINKGYLATAANTKVMEFLFYRKEIGSSEAIFFDKVKELFFKEFNINISHKPDITNLEVINTIKNIKSATKIKAIFKKAYEAIDYKNLNISKASIIDPNSTALCLLHRNLKALYGSIGNKYQEYSDWRPFSRQYCYLLQKTDFLRQEFYSDNQSYYSRGNTSGFPNVLLTSDSFLKTEENVSELFTKYKYYQDDFWLFQTPHHGSKNNCDKNLLAQISRNKFNFINYGINNRDNHPDKEVILDLISTGHHKNLIPINQFQGFSFELVHDYDY